MIKYVLVLMLMSSCMVVEPSVDYLVKDGVRRYLMNNVNDNRKYESVSYGVIDSVYAIGFSEVVQGILSGDTLGGDKISGYRVTHKFRATNDLGALVLYEEVFILDTNYVVIEAY